MADNEQEQKKLSEREYALLKAKKRIEYEFAARHADIDVDVPEMIIREQVRDALMNLDEAERRDLMEAKQAAFDRINEAFDEVEDREALVDRYDADDLDL